jgi:tRNA/rRNA methyltransferase
MHIRIILNEPLYAGNVGSIARVLKNFGHHDLALVNPCPIDNEAWMMAQHAYDLLEGARVFETLREATEGSNLIIGTTGMRGTTGEASVVSIVFGREDHGLTNEELMVCDMLMSIPTSEQYPIMNLSHAVAVVLYELSDLGIGDILLADRYDLDLLYEHLESVLSDLGYPAHKKHKTTLMLRRIFGRAELTAREVYTLRGILRLVDYRL